MQRIDQGLEREVTNFGIRTADVLAMIRLGIKVTRWNFPQWDSHIELLKWPCHDGYYLGGSFLGRFIGSFDSDELAIAAVEEMIDNDLHFPWVKRYR